MAIEEQMHLLREGVHGWNAWRAANPGTKPYLWKCDLQGSNLQNADLRECTLAESNLSNADLTGALLSFADLSSCKLNAAILANANLHCAWLNFSDLNGADLSGAYMVHTNLLKADLRGANLMGCDLTRANLSWGKFANTNFDKTVFARTLMTHCASLHLALHLETAVHIEASVLDESTLRSCVIHLPDVFLTGVGLTVEEIRNLRVQFG